MNVFFYMGTIGVLSMLVAYIVVNLGAMRFLHLGRREALWRVTVWGVRSRRDSLRRAMRPTDRWP